MRSHSAYYYIAIVPVWMVINLLLQRAVRLTQRVLRAAWRGSVSTLRQIRWQHQHDRALRRWLRSVEAL